jgi:hypothetical protein
MLTAMRECLAAIALVVALAGCGGRIPNKVSADEYGVYAEWMKVHFSKNPPSNLYIGSRTFVFDALKTDGCGNAIHDKAGVPWALIKQLHALGEAEYSLPDVYSPTKLRIPWSYKVVDDWRLVSQEPGLYRLVDFSRVAFDSAYSKALFAVSDTSGGVGWGGAVYAHKKNGAWVFESGGCNWAY